MLKNTTHQTVTLKGFPNGPIPVGPITNNFGSSVLRTNNYRTAENNNNNNNTTQNMEWQRRERGREKKTNRTTHKIEQFIVVRCCGKTIERTRILAISQQMPGRIEYQLWIIYERRFFFLSFFHTLSKFGHYTWLLYIHTQVDTDIF